MFIMGVNTLQRPQVLSLRLTQQVLRSRMAHSDVDVPWLHGQLVASGVQHLFAQPAAVSSDMTQKPSTNAHGGTTRHEELIEIAHFQ